MKLRFNDWVYHYGGVTKLAKELGCTTHCVRVWLRGDCSPSAAMIARLIKISKGEMTFDQIFKETTRSKIICQQTQN